MRLWAGPGAGGGGAGGRDGQLLLDTVLRLAPQGRGAAAARRRVSRALAAATGWGIGRCRVASRASEPGPEEELGEAPPRPSGLPPGGRVPGGGASGVGAGPAPQPRTRPAGASLRPPPGRSNDTGRPRGRRAGLSGAATWVQAERRRDRGLGLAGSPRLFGFSVPVAEAVRSLFP